MGQPIPLLVYLCVCIYMCVYLSVCMCGGDAHSSMPRQLHIHIFFQSSIQSVHHTVFGYVKLWAENSHIQSSTQANNFHEAHSSGLQYWLQLNLLLSHMYGCHLCRNNMFAKLTYAEMDQNINYYSTRYSTVTSTLVNPQNSRPNSTKLVSDMKIIIYLTHLRCDLNFFQ